MAISIIRGPAGGGKSQVVTARLGADEVWIDFQRLWAALVGAERGPDGKYPVRLSSDQRIAYVARVKELALQEAAARGLDGYVTTSDSADAELVKLRGLGADGEVVTVFVPRSLLERRLADSTGRLSRECESALDRWFK